MIRRALRQRSAQVAVTFLGLVLLLVITGDLFAPQDPLAQDTGAVLQGSTTAHWLGTDYLGRDVLSRLIAGTRVSVLAALTAVVIGAAGGIVPGMLSAFSGKVVTWTSLRVADAFMALPFIIFAIAVAGLFGNGLFQAMVAVGVLIAPVYFRIIRAASLSHAGAQYVEAATLLGAPWWHVLRVHIWPKVLPAVVVTTANLAAGGLLVVSSLTFLGIGIQPPEPTWGGMLASDLGYLTQRPFGPVAPALAIMCTVAALNLLADAIRDASGDAGRAAEALRNPLKREVVADVR